jgi:ribonuclease G
MEENNLKRDIIINVSEFETRLAILEDSRLVELWVERPEAERRIGDIYKGVIKSVFPGMQAAFIDIGLEKNAFLHVSDLGIPPDLWDEKAYHKKRKIHQKIEEVLKKDQEILIQIIKEPIGTKGPRVSSQISLAGRYLVLAPGEDHLAVSRKIKDPNERKRLKNLVSEFKPPGSGLIIRTVAEGKEKKEFKSDVKMLARLWQKIKKKAEKKKAPALIHEDIGMISGVMRDTLSPQVNEVVVDLKSEYKKILSYLKSIAPAFRSRVRFYDKDIPIFDFYNIEPELEKMLERKVWLKKGAYIVIDQTEAMVTIDVNTGRFVGKSNQPQTILNANLEAAKEIARQIRLRDIGGLIIIDFIDMESREDRKKVYDEFRTALRNDRSKSSILPISDFGLIEMTRERTKPSFIFTYSDPCPCCRGTGRIVSKETQATKIERWFKRARVLTVDREYKLILSQELFKILVEGRKSRIKKLQKELKIKIETIKDSSLPPEGYRILTTEDLDVTDKFKG